MAPKQLKVGGLLENGKLLPPDRREVESKLDNTRCGVKITVCGDSMTFEFEFSGADLLRNLLCLK